MCASFVLILCPPVSFVTLSCKRLDATLSMHTSSHCAPPRVDQVCACRRLSLSRARRTYHFASLRLLAHHAANELPADDSDVAGSILRAPVSNWDNEQSMISLLPWQRSIDVGTRDCSSQARRKKVSFGTPTLKTLGR